ncbi:ABC transporter substrate-binding protein [Chitinophaga agrisoli]|uniref:ABC transporter substrate-binding protein n=1 Tax=Chitinophaga agrisoli TaxID=2607653 RepID=A0A5B2VRF1_9BACT|nr:helical backbone metal receptor [Chitinophaga agrisoli]KAA2240812.1 ABC transporter substrate-binding protein [Chitinophaga agrisoli]
MQLHRLRPFLILLCTCLLLTVAGFAQPAKRIVSLNGTVTEIICALGFEQSLAGVDVTSTWPASVRQLPKVGHNRNISAEPVLALQPDLILATDNFLTPAVLEQFKQTGVKTVVLKQEFTLAGTKQLIRQVAAALQAPEKGNALCQQLDKEQLALHITQQSKKVLFIYARGAGTLMVAGQETPLDHMITLAGAQNAANGFKDFKPLTTEALVAANPDVILLFDTGLQSVGGVNGLLKVPGIPQTNAGKQQKIVAMDGQLLSGFGPRVIQAIKELSVKLQGV